MTCVRSVYRWESESRFYAAWIVKIQPPNQIPPQIFASSSSRQGGKFWQANKTQPADGQNVSIDGSPSKVLVGLRIA